MMKEMMPKMMPEMMKGMDSMSPDDMIATMQEMMPQMIENCLATMVVKDRKRFLDSYKTMLGEMEEKFVK
jgi:hypothetical protein